jgi:hypothetical protein
VKAAHMTVNQPRRSVKCRAHAGAFLAIVGTVLLVLTSAMTSNVSLAASQIFVMGGTGQPLSSPQEAVTDVQQYLGQATANFVDPLMAVTWSVGDATPDTIAIITPEQVRYNTGLNDLTSDESIAEGRQDLDNCIRGIGCNYNAVASYGAPSAASDANPVQVFGYSQSATIAMLEKADLAAAYAAGVVSTPGPGALSFVVIGDPNRPNGGYMARGPNGLTISFLGATFSGPAATNTPYSTVDIAQEYDGAADGPVNPLNLLAVANALLGMAYLHHNYGSVSLTEPGVVNQGTYGDTTYYLIPGRVIPLLIPVTQMPVIGPTLADTLNPTLQVIVESAYNRWISPGQPTQWNPLYFPNPISLAVNLLVSIPTGLDNGIQDLVGVRPFGTQRPGPYGVGGPSVTYVTPPAQTTSAPLLNLAVGRTAVANPNDPTRMLADHAQLGPTTGPASVDTPAASPISSSADNPPGITKRPQLPIRLPIGIRSGTKSPTSASNDAAVSEPHDGLQGTPLRSSTENANRKGLSPAGRTGSAPNDSPTQFGRYKRAGSAHS